MRKISPIIVILPQNDSTHRKTCETIEMAFKRILSATLLLIFFYADILLSTQVETADHIEGGTPPCFVSNDFFHESLDCTLCRYQDGTISPLCLTIDNGETVDISSINGFEDDEAQSTVRAESNSEIEVSESFRIQRSSFPRGRVMFYMKCKGRASSGVSMEGILDIPCSSTATKKRNDHDNSPKLIDSEWHSLQRLAELGSMTNVLLLSETDAQVPGTVLRALHPKKKTVSMNDETISKKIEDERAVIGEMEDT